MNIVLIRRQTTKGVIEISLSCSLKNVEKITKCARRDIIGLNYIPQNIGKIINEKELDMVDQMLMLLNQKRFFLLFHKRKCK